MTGDDAGRFLDALFGSTEGVAWVSAKKLPNGKWLQGHGNWPAARTKMLATIRQHDDTGHDVYLCTTLRRPGTTNRQVGQAVELRWLHVDLDPDKDDTPRDGPTLDPALYRKLAPMRVGSGSPGHEHAYIQLTEPIDLPRWKALQRALDQRLGGDHKLADNDVLRVPGTHHRKPGKPASLVQVIEWGGEPWDAAELAELRGVDLSRTGPSTTASPPVDTPRGPLPEEATVEPPFDELDLPYSADVERAWHNEIPKNNGQGADRSEVIYGLVKACQRAGYSLDDAIELAQHHEPTRKKWRTAGRIANDVQRIWSKPVNDRQPDDVEADDDELDEDDLDRRYVDWPKLWRRDPTEVRWAVEPIAEVGQQAAMYSPPKTGKSLLSLEIAAALATGHAVLDQPAGDPIDVLYVDHENTEDDLAERLAALGYGEADDLSRLHYSLLADWPPLDTWNGGKALLDAVHEFGARLVVVDSVQRAVEGDENEADTIRAMYRHALKALKRERVTVIRLDNSGKDTRKGMRGSSAKVDDVDIVWELSEVDDTSLTLRRTHSRRRPRCPEILYVRRTGEPLAHTVERTGDEQDAQHERDVDRIVKLLDDLLIPSNKGRVEVRKLLTAGGHKAVRNEVLSEAIKRRREQPY